MQNIRDLRKSLLSNYKKMENGSMDLKKGNALANTASKIMSTLKIEMQHNSQLGNKSKIEFLKSK